MYPNHYRFDNASSFNFAVNVKWSSFISMIFGGIAYLLYIT